MGRSHDQFHHFFFQWDERLKAIIRDNCSAEFQEYNDPDNHSRPATYNLIECMLDQFPSYRQAEIAVSGVILGLAPQIIHSVGANSVQISLLSLQRPLLALLISAGSPA